MWHRWLKGVMELDYRKTNWKPVLFVTFVIALSFISAYNGRLYASVRHDNSTVNDSSQDSCGNKIFTNNIGLRNFHVCRARKANRTFRQAKGSFIFCSNCTLTSLRTSISGTNTKQFLPGLDSMDKYLKLPSLVNPTRHDVENEIWQKRDYKLLISHNATCSPLRVKNNTSSSSKFDFNDQVFLLMTVKTSCGHRFRRKAIRDTWGNETWIANYLDVRAKLLFLLGKCQTNEDAEKLVIESNMHKDIIQWDFVDDFRNLTLKQFLFWQWYATHCLEVPFLYQGDDDVLVNTVNIVNHLLSIPHENEQNLWNGSVLWYGLPIRDPSSRYYVSKAIYPAKHYPPYVSGGGYIISGYLVVRVFLQTLATRIIQVDDAFLGILANAVGVAPVFDNDFRSWGLNDSASRNVAHVKSYHRTLPFAMIVMWEDLLDYYSTRG